MLTVPSSQSPTSGRTLDQQPPLQPDLPARIVVQQEWNGWRTAMVELEDLSKIHWHQPHGAARPLIHAYVPCTRIRSGTLPHDCERTSAPHLLLVCVLKHHTAPGVFARLASQADAYLS